MKKIILGLILLIVCGMIVVPDLVAAQGEKPNECCILRHDMRVGNINYSRDSIVGAPTNLNPWCDVDGDGISNSITNPTTNWGMICMVDSIMTVTDWIFYILLLVAVIMIIIGGFMFITSAGSPEKATGARQILIYAIIGLIIAVLAKLIPSIVRFVIGM